MQLALKLPRTWAGRPHRSADRYRQTEPKRAKCLGGRRPTSTGTPRCTVLRRSHPRRACGRTVAHPHRRRNAYERHDRGNRTAEGRAHRPDHSLAPISRSGRVRPVGTIQGTGRVPRVRPPREPPRTPTGSACASGVAPRLLSGRRHCCTDRTPAPGLPIGTRAEWTVAGAGCRSTMSHRRSWADAGESRDRRAPRPQPAGRPRHDEAARGRAGSTMLAHDDPGSAQFGTHAG